MFFFLTLLFPDIKTWRYLSYSEMENSTTTISREELEELQEAFNKIGKLEKN